MTSVALLGGGVGGLTAAHELAERGIKVTVYEMHDVFGGKARSMPVPNSGKDGRKDLPGEHGFRFFPNFYRHLTDTMERIPYEQRTVGDNLVEATEVLLAQGVRIRTIGPCRRLRHPPRTAMPRPSPAVRGSSLLTCARQHPIEYSPLQLRYACDEGRFDIGDQAPIVA